MTTNLRSPGSHRIYAMRWSSRSSSRKPRDCWVWASASPELVAQFAATNDHGLVTQFAFPGQKVTSYETIGGIFRTVNTLHELSVTERIWAILEMVKIMTDLSPIDKRFRCNYYKRIIWLTLSTYELKSALATLRNLNYLYYLGLEFSVYHLFKRE